MSLVFRAWYADMSVMSPPKSRLISSTVIRPNQFTQVPDRINRKYHPLYVTILLAAKALSPASSVHFFLWLSFHGFFKVLSPVYHKMSDVMDSWVIEMIANLVCSLSPLCKKRKVVCIFSSSRKHFWNCENNYFKDKYLVLSSRKELYISISRSIGYRRLYQLGLTFVLNMFFRTLIRQLYSYPEAIEYIVLSSFSKTVAFFVTGFSIFAHLN